MGFIGNANREERKTAACVLLQSGREHREKRGTTGSWRLGTVTSGGGRLEGEDLWDSQEIEARGWEGLPQVFFIQT